ncbi:MAG: hypothetical protein M1826_004500 [Phylliscum demangeonii]|nr:MAG: hypothetical protein M1826_004500 [Phylliscum demangeonii]
MANHIHLLQMSGFNKLEKFVQNRHRPHLSPAPHDAASKAVTEQSLRRTAIAANARVPPPVTRLQSSPPSHHHRSSSVPHERDKLVENRSFSASPDGGNQSRDSGRVRTDSAGHSAPEPDQGRDVFDTDIEDLTESLVSDDAQTSHTGRVNAAYLGRGGHRGPGEEPALSARFRQSMGPSMSGPAARASHRTNGHHLDAYEPAEQEEEGSSDEDMDGDEDARAGDDPTLTFTPEQAARVQDLSRQALQVAERPRPASQSAPGPPPPPPPPIGANGGQTDDIYDLTKPLHEHGNMRTSHAVPDPGPFAPRKGSATDGMGTAHAERLLPPADHGLAPASLEPHAIHNPAPSISTPTPTRPAPAPPHTPELDYPPTILHTMSYADLANQAFDEQPNPAPSILPPSHQHSALPQQLAHVLSLPVAQQRLFFGSLPAGRWEECGDWFVEQFTALMAQMRAARRAKRDVALAFEQEMARREKVVRALAEGYDATLEDMKRGGRGLLALKGDGGGNGGAGKGL